MRFRSLDVFRGLTVAAMVIVNNPGDWAHVYPPLLHAAWHGWTPTDLIFPFFLFIVGASLAMGRGAHGTWGAVIRRGVVIWGLGLSLAGFPFFGLARWRVPGVLARIAWCYVAAAVTVRLLADTRRPHPYGRVAAAAIAVLVAHGLVLLWLPAPGGTAGDLSPSGNLGAWLDRAVFGRHLWKADWDPEGLFSSVPAVGTTLLGTLAGWWMQDAPSPRAAVRGLALAALGGVCAGLAWSIWLPINKSLWTSSYVLFTAGVAAAILAACHWWCDLQPTARLRRLTEPFVALGRNAILLFVVSGLAAKTFIYLKWPDPAQSLGHWIYTSAFLPLASPVNASLLYACANLLVLYLPLTALHRRGLYLRA